MPLPSVPPAPPAPPAPPTIAVPPIAPITFTKADAAQLVTRSNELKIKTNGKITLPVACPAGVDCEVKASLTIPKGEITGTPVSDGSQRTRSLGKPIEFTIDAEQTTKKNVSSGFYIYIRNEKIEENAPGHACWNTGWTTSLSCEMPGGNDHCTRTNSIL